MHNYKKTATGGATYRDVEKLHGVVEHEHLALEVFALAGRSVWLTHGALLPLVATTHNGLSRRGRWIRLMRTSAGTALSSQPCVYCGHI